MSKDLCILVQPHSKVRSWTRVIHKKITIKRISRAILNVKTCTIILGTPLVTRTGLVVKSLFITCQKRVCRGGDRRTRAIDTVQEFLRAENHSTYS